MRNKEEGFTLIEVIVVIAVVAILAAILTPTVVKNIDDSKVARAKNETQVIGAAMTSFYKDLGRWPTSNGTANNPDYIYLLYGPGNAPTNQGTNTIYWRKDAGWPDARKDTFTNHLIENDPKDGGTDYPTSGEYKWHGPYIAEIKADPWGSHYASNVVYFYGGTGTPNAVWVWSAGPDRQADTRVDQAMSTAVLGDDDIGVRLK